MIYIPIGFVIIGFFILLKDLSSLENQIFRVEDALERLEKKLDNLEDSNKETTEN